jgi:hypothetical protein
MVRNREVVTANWPTVEIAEKENPWIITVDSLSLYRWKFVDLDERITAGGNMLH